MRLFLLPALVAPVLCAAQAPAPVISFDNLHHDFGKITPDRKVSHRFKVSNTGKAFLNITRLSPSCGCTATVIEGNKWSLAPGESTFIEATFDPHGYRGPARKSIQVISDDPENPTVTLSFEAEIIQEIMPSTTAVFFYDVQRSATVNATVRLESGNGQPVQVKEVKAPGAPYLSATVRAEGKDAVLNIALDGHKLLPGRMTGVDALTVVTGNERVPIISINVQWEVKSSVVATPDRVSWVEPAGKELRAPLALKQADGKAFRVLDARYSNSLIRIEGMGKGSASQHDLQVILSASAKPGVYNETLVLMLDDPDQPELTIRVSAVLR